MNKRIINIICLIFLTVSVFAARYAGDFMVIGAGVRSSGMGGAFSAIADDGSAIYWNASGIAQMRRSEIGLMRAFLYKNLATYDNFTYCQPLPNEVTIGFNWTRLSIDDIPVFLEEHLIYNVDYRSSYHEYNLSADPDGEISETQPDTRKLWVLWLKKNGATSDNYTDAWKEFLVASGYDGIIPDDISLYFEDNS